MKLISYLPSVILWGVFLYAFGQDRSRYRNCVLLFAALCETLRVILLTIGERALTMGLVFVLFVLMLVPFFLIWNGIVMIRREGVSAAHILSLLLGIAVGVGEIATFLWYLAPHTLQPAEKAMQTLSAVVGLTVFYASLSFLMFMIYAVFLMIIPRRRDFDYVIVLGAGLRDGMVPTKLLSDRIDKAIKVYHQDPTAPYLVPSGGKGDDEKIPEAEAMKRYMLEKGIPEEKIIAEDASATTRENLANSKQIIEERGGGRYIAIVTSNYHVYRALRYARRIGLNCTGIGSHVAYYFWPSALIREYIAIHAEKKHALIFLAGWLLLMFIVLMPMM